MRPVHGGQNFEPFKINDLVADIDDFARIARRPFSGVGKPMPRYALQIEYDGGPFAGWQRQAQGLPSVQEAVEKALAKK